MTDGEWIIMVQTPWWASITKTVKDVKSAEMLFNLMILESHNCQHRSKQLFSSVFPIFFFLLEELYYTEKHCWGTPFLVLFEKPYNGPSQAHCSTHHVRCFARRQPTPFLWEQIPPTSTEVAFCAKLETRNICKLNFALLTIITLIQKKLVQKCYLFSQQILLILLQTQREPLI